MKIPKAHHRENELPTPQDQAALSGPSAPVVARQAREPNLSMNCNCGDSTVSAHQRHTNSIVQNCAGEISNFCTVWTKTGTCRHKNNGRVNNPPRPAPSVNVNIIFSAILSHSPCGLSSLIEYHFCYDPGPRNDHCPAPNLFA